MEELEYKVNELTFKPTHEFKKFVISLTFTYGNYGTNIMYFKPCMGEEKFLESEEIFKQLLEEFFKNPSIFVSYWSKSMTIQKIKNWVENIKFNRFEFRLMIQEHLLDLGKLS